MKYKINIKSLTSGILSLLMAMIFFACKDELINSNEKTETLVPAKTYYLTLNINTQGDAITRAGDDENENSNRETAYGPETNTDGSSTQGTVSAKENENKINTAEIYVCTGNTVLASFYSPTSAQVMTRAQAGYSSSDEIDWVLRAELTQKQIEDFAQYGDKGLDLYVVANMSTGNNFAASLLKNSEIDEDATFKTDRIGSSPIEDFGTEGKVLPLMNANKLTFNKLKDTDVKAALETKVEALLKMFKSNQTGISVLDMGTLNLERGVARIEYKDYARTGKNEDRKANLANTADNADLPDNTFVINGVSFKIELKSLQVFNVNKESYLFRHSSEGIITSTGSYAYGKPTIFGFERGTGSGYTWIANPDWESTNEDVSEINNFTKEPDFYNSLDLSTSFLVTDDKDKTIQSSYGIIDVETLLNRKTNDEDGYHPWCYITENTMPSTDYFKDELDSNNTTAPDGSDNTTSSLPPVMQYATGVAFKFLVLDKTGEPLQYDSENYPDEIKKDSENSDNKAIIITDRNNQWMKVLPEKYKEGEDEKTGYFLTYIAPIVHNSQQGYNPSAGNYPPMFYGVVRNNTYQMSINSITGLPRPNQPSSMFIKIDIKVLAWARHDITVTF